MEYINRLPEGPTGTQKKSTMSEEKEDNGKDRVSNILKNLEALTAAIHMTNQDSLLRRSQNIMRYSCQEIGHISQPNRRGTDRRMNRSGERFEYSRNTNQGVQGNYLNYQGPN